MLDFYFASDVRKRQLRRGPLAKYLDGLAAEFQRECYARHTARRILSIVGQFSCYARLVGAAAESIDERLVDRFLADESVGDGVFQDGPKAMRHLLRYLRKQGVIAPSAPPARHPFAATLEGFDTYLGSVRGLVATTRRCCLSSARALVDWLRERYGDQALGRIAGTDVLEFITEQIGRWQSRSSRAHICSRIRGFLRYLHASGAIGADLARAVPRVSTPRLASLPRGLPWEQVRALVDGVDSSHPDGMRDKALLLLLATLGLRSSEARALELGHIAWRAGEIRLPRTKARRERILPLLPEVGNALADYVLHGRPALAVPQVLLRHGPRPGPLASANTVIWIVRRHLHRAGILIARGGAHMLRHSLATRMVNAGVPIKSVADVLGHASIDTTAIYTKVDQKTLAAMTLPFPGGAR
jgi:site-specific recombinase XerD